MRNESTARKGMKSDGQKSSLSIAHSDLAAMAGTSQVSHQSCACRDASGTDVLAEYAPYYGNHRACRGESSQTLDLRTVDLITVLLFQNGKLVTDLF